MAGEEVGGPPGAALQAQPGAGPAAGTPALLTPSISAPTGGGAIRGIGETFTATPATGTGSMSVPIPVSAGRSGFGPQLTLSYDSGRGNGPFGFGWSLSLPAITRRTDQGLPRYADAEDSNAEDSNAEGAKDAEDADVFLLGEAEDLVPLLAPAAPDGGGWARVTLSAGGYRIDRYRPRVDATFARIERWTRTGDGDVHWRSVNRDNVTTVYGADTSSRIADPHDPARVFSWLICRSYDDRGNAVSYEYAVEDGAGADLAAAHERHRSAVDRRANRYLKRIRYGNRTSRLLDPDLADPGWLFEVVLDYGDHDPDAPGAGGDRPWTCRDDPFSSYRAGFEVRTYRLCRRVLMFHHFPDEPAVGAGCLVRSTDLEYRPGEAVGTFLASVTQRGYRRTGEGHLSRAMPPLEFSYSPATLHHEVREMDPASLANVPAGVDGGYQWADLDGEGISGLLAPLDRGWYYKPNLGTGRLGPLQPLPSVPSAVDGVHLVDLDGDGRLDVVAFGGPVPGSYERTEAGGWSEHRALTAVPVLDWGQPGLHFTDLDGDGRADVLVTEGDAVTWHASRGADGFGPARRLSVPRDEAAGPAVVADGGRVQLADMTGDGLADLVRIRYGEVCYWPNLGHGRFGRRVTMDAAPLLDRDEDFDPRYLRLADVDGSGPADLVYLGADAVRVYFNRSGNSWTPAHRLPATPAVDNRAAVSIVDLLGTGTACLVWSHDTPGQERRSIQYLDLLGGSKPHLLVGVDNNLGARTTVRYAPSTAFYLADKAAGRPWRTRLPFPVHVVERVETQDRISRNRFVTRYAYHHGFFDGEEREFRGFGLVEQWDTEEFDTAGDTPPVLTRAWFHTGGEADHTAEFWREPGPAVPGLTPAPLPTGIRLADGSTVAYDPSGEELREARRALRGCRLRQEVYALDGTEREPLPYSVTEHGYAVELLQPKAGNRHAVCSTYPRETLTARHERTLHDVEVNGTAVRRADPRLTHELTLQVDGWGDVLRSATVGYGRRYPDAGADPMLPAPVLDALRAAQTTARVTVTVNEYTNPVLTGTDHRGPLPAGSRRHELVNVAPAAGDRFTAGELMSLVDSAVDLPYEDVYATGATGNQPYRRLLEQTRTLYRRDDLTGPLPAGTAEPLGLPYQTYRLAFTPGLLSTVYPMLPDPSAALAEGGHVPVDGGWWIPGARAGYAADPLPPAQELAQARAHFFLPRRHTDAFGHATTAEYDPYDLLPVSTVDPVGNVTTAVERDYRVLAPRVVADPNGNRTEVLFDALGNVVATAVTGKPDDDLGDSLAGLEADLPDPVRAAHFADPLADPHALLGGASTRLVYDVLAFHRTRDDPEPSPVAVATLTRETRRHDLPPGGQTRVRHRLAYGDGFGREIQTKDQAEPGPGPGPRWVGSGWTVFNNKGEPVRRYEPFFSTSHGFEFAPTVGVSPLLCYDPIGRVVATLHPDDSYAKVVFDAWQQSTWDGNDTLLLDPRLDDDVRARVGPLPPGWQTWYQRRAGGGLGPREQAAASATQPHAGTPTVTYADVLGRAVLTVADNAVERLATRSVLDVEGAQLELVDPRGVVIQRAVYDAAGRRLRTDSPDAGPRWVLPDVSGGPVRRWDGLGHAIVHAYDPARRPTGMWVDGLLVELTRYGEGHPQADALNLRGRVHLAFDGAGLTVSQRYDLAGNLAAARRRLARDYQSGPDWSTVAGVAVDTAEAVAGPLLEPEAFTTELSYDALDRPVRQVQPDGTTVRSTFNEAGLLETVVARWPGATTDTAFVTGIAYQAKGQRERIDYANGTATTYEYDPLTFRLRRLTTTRGGDTLQDLSYVYDPVGHLVDVRDDAQQTVFFAGQVVPPAARYGYDPVYRLVSATGREHASLGVQPDHADPVRRPVPHPNDGAALRTYTQHYAYDPAGNILTMAHVAGAGSWTRQYGYAADSNRLLSHTLPGGSGSVTVAHDAHGNLTALPHLPAIGWNAEDQTSTVDLGGGGQAYYAYDGSGRRVRAVIQRLGGLVEERVYLGDYEVHSRRLNGTLTHQRQTVHLTDDHQIVALAELTTVDTGAPAEVGQRRLRYQLADGLGSSTIELDEAAAVIAYEEYHPFGTTSVWLAAGAAEVSVRRYRYTGKEKDAETGLYYHGARYYACWLGRWTSPDPAGVADSVNRYAYVSNNPVNQRDTDGRQGTIGGLTVSPSSRISAQEWVGMIQRNQKLEPWMREVFVARGNTIALSTKFVKPNGQIIAPTGSTLPTWFANTLVAIREKQWHLTTGVSIVSDPGRNISTKLLPDAETGDLPMVTGNNVQPNDVINGETIPSESLEGRGIARRQMEDRFATGVDAAGQGTPGNRRPARFDAQGTMTAPAEGLVVVSTRFRDTATGGGLDVARSEEAMVETLFHELGAHAGPMSMAGSDQDKWDQTSHGTTAKPTLADALGAMVLADLRPPSEARAVQFARDIGPTGAARVARAMADLKKAIAELQQALDQLNAVSKGAKARPPAKRK